MRKELYLKIDYYSKVEKNNQTIKDEWQSQCDVVKNKKFFLFEISDNAYIKDVFKDEVLLYINKKGEFRLTINESISFSYYDCNEVCGDTKEKCLKCTITLTCESIYK